MHSPLPGQRERRWSNKVPQRTMPQTRPSGHPKTHARFSETMWSLAAVHKPLHATREAPTMRPSLHELATLQRQFTSKCTRGYPSPRMSHCIRCFKFLNPVLCPRPLTSQHHQHAPCNSKAAPPFFKDFGLALPHHGNKQIATPCFRTRPSLPSIHHFALKECLVPPSLFFSTTLLQSLPFRCRLSFSCFVEEVFALP